MGMVGPHISRLIDERRFQSQFVEAYLGALTADGDDRAREGCASAASDCDFAARLQLHWWRAFVSATMSNSCGQSSPLLLIDQQEVNCLGKMFAAGILLKEGSIVLTLNDHLERPLAVLIENFA